MPPVNVSARVFTKSNSVAEKPHPADPNVCNCVSVPHPGPTDPTDLTGSAPLEEPDC